ncbi:MAG TPA: RNB domain-containing ribonuclease, partial [Gemmatimonadaceae bacterium]|nr:RNB domain-containing ribonuclease [Gemmatimonadaceae bacterium]
VPDVPAAVQAEVARAGDNGAGAAILQDLRQLPWSSIDNDSSRDLDQIEVAERAGDGSTRVRVAIADVDGTVVQASSTDQYAATNATSVYTGVATFPMLPDRLSTQLTSLVQDEDRPAVVIEFVVTTDGDTQQHSVYRARVRNQAKLAYASVGAWLDGHGALPPAATPVIQEQLRLQDAVAQTLRANRARRGALSLETIEAQPVEREDHTIDIELVQKTRASHLIEDFMIAANVAMAQFLDEHNSPTIRRVVRTPERWERIVALAASMGEKLSTTPDPASLEGFLARRRAADPDHFPDLSLSVVKLIGPGEYAMHMPGVADAGHFGLATHDYTHSTAPNRRFADLVTQRLLKAVLAGSPPPYSTGELAKIAAHCTEREDAARKVERLVRKQAAAVSMASHVGETFDAIVTGVTPKGTFVRVVTPPVEGRVMRGEQGLDVGDRVRATLLATDPAQGFVDFAVGRESAPAHTGASTATGYVRAR